MDTRTTNNQQQQNTRKNIFSPRIILGADRRLDLDDPGLSQIEPTKHTQGSASLHVKTRREVEVK
jgi:hypothetical protein